MLKPTCLLVLLLGMAGTLPAAPMLFVGMDITGTGAPNATAARNQFLSYLSGAGTDSLESLATCFQCAPFYPVTFNGGLTGELYGDSIIGSGFDGVRSLRTEPGGWDLAFSQPVSAAGFVTTFSHSPSSDGVIRSLLCFTVGGLPRFVIDPADYGIPRNAGVNAFIGFVDLVSPHGSIAFEHLDEMFSNRFNTDLFTAATPDQVVPEPSTWAALAAGLGAVAWQRRRRLSQG